jgi:Flp pilus assembly pilin Flp
MKIVPKRKAGQAMTEYLIIVVLVAMAALVLFGLFGDTIQKKLGGAIDELEGDSSGSEAARSSKTYLQDLGSDEDN